MAIAYVNSTAGTMATAASTWSIATHSSRVGGAAYIVGIGLASTTVTVTAMTDNTTNVYALAKRKGAGKPQGVELWYSPACSSLSTRVSVTLSGASSGSIALGQWTGVSTANALGLTSTGATLTVSSLHTCVQLTPAWANAAVIGFSRTAASSMVPVTIDGGMSAWCSTLAAVRTVGLYIIQGAASTCTGQWRTGAASSTGLCMAASVIAAFGDTNTAPVGGTAYRQSFCLMGVC